MKGQTGSYKPARNTSRLTPHTPRYRPVPRPPYTNRTPLSATANSELLQASSFVMGTQSFEHATR